MNTPRLKIAATVVLGALALAGPAGSGFAQAGLANLRQETVLSGALINGNRLDLNRFTDERSAQALLDEVRTVWSQRPAPIHSVAGDGWFTLTQLVGSTIEIFEVRSAGAGVHGRWSRWRKDDSGLVPGADWLEQALPAGSRVLDRIVHQDGGRQMTTVVAATPGASSNVLSRDLISALKQQGFRGDPRAAPSLNGEGRVFFLARGSEDIAVTISEHAGQRAIVMHWGRAMP